MTHRDLLRSQLLARYPNGVNLSKEGLMQLVDRVYDAAYSKGVDDAQKVAEVERPTEPFNDMLKNLFKWKSGN